ncbi:alpha/beta fold hydrolase [Spongisporangium articulatum]|uniref:Alpha/beta fold hydrolase n=1 Tax=Spongisporangium articulatum TaxID=3362603 RepID=A0ABW8AWG0_9ACTN
MSAARGVKLPALTTLSMPLLVINGERDPIMKVSGGRATARAVPGSRFVSYPDMAHAIPPSRWSSVIDEVARIAGQM